MGAGKVIIGFRWFSFLVVALVFLSSCATYQKVAPISKTFLEDVDTTKKMDNLPFDHSWVWFAADQKLSGKLYIKPIRTDLLPADAWRANITVGISSREDYLAKATEVASYFHERLIAEAKVYPDLRVTILDKPESGSEVMEIALTELQFSKPVARAAAMASPIPGTGAALSAISDPHVSFALRVTFADSGQLIATAADRKFPPARLLDLNKLTVSSPAREICANWAKMIIDAIQKGKLEKVEKRGVFSILPW